MPTFFLCSSKSKLEAFKDFTPLLVDAGNYREMKQSAAGLRSPVQKKARQVSSIQTRPNHLRQRTGHDLERVCKRASPSVSHKTKATEVACLDAASQAYF